MPMSLTLSTRIATLCAEHLYVSSIIAKAENLALFPAERLACASNGFEDVVKYDLLACGGVGRVVGEMDDAQVKRIVV